MNELTLTGLDGTNPLGFLAALGVLAIADTVGPHRAGVSWRNEGRWRPVLTSALDRAGLLEAIDADVRTWRDDPTIGLAYHKGDDDESSAKKKAKEPKLARDLKPSPERFSTYLGGLLARVDQTVPIPPFLRSTRRGLDYAAVFGTEVAVDNKGNTKPTALHFTAGQQEFLKSVLELAEGVSTADFEEAVFGPWRYARPLPVLGWDSSVARDYALRADDPAKNKKTGVPGADWLAFRGLAFVPVAPVGTEIRTAGCGGGWKSGHFTWPLWSGLLGVGAVRSVLTIADLDDTTAHERRARGLAVVLRAIIRRSDQGGYGSFQPASVLPPAKSRSA